MLHNYKVNIFSLSKASDFQKSPTMPCCVSPRCKCVVSGAFHRGCIKRYTMWCMLLQFDSPKPLFKLSFQLTMHSAIVYILHYYCILFQTCVREPTLTVVPPHLSSVHIRVCHFWYLEVGVWLVVICWETQSQSVRLNLFSYYWICHFTSKCDQHNITST